MQPAASGLDGVGVKLMKGEAEDAEGRVNEDVFWRRREEDVPVDQVCLFAFLNLLLGEFRVWICSSFSSINFSRERTRGRELMLRRGVKGRTVMRKRRKRIQAWTKEVQIVVKMKVVRSKMRTRTKRTATTRKRRSGR